MTELIVFFNTILWDSILFYLLIGAGLYFTWRTRGMQLRCLSGMVGALRLSRVRQPGGLTSWQALCLTLGARIGPGNLTGVAIALENGGPGAIFWMWVMTWIGMMTTLAESTLAQLYKSRDGQGRFRGGPAYYMARGLGMRWLGVLFALLLIATFGLTLNTLQANALAEANRLALHCPPLGLAAALLLLAGGVMLGGLSRIACTLALLVPLMLLLYLGLAGWTILSHAAELPRIALAIFRGAFGLEEAMSGAVGYGISQAMSQGLQQGLQTNEAGIGSVPNAAASAAPQPAHPVSQGYVQMLGAVLDTVVIGSATALVLLLAGLPAVTADAPSLARQAMAACVELWGGAPMMAVTALFTLTALLGNYVYAESNLLFLTRNRTGGLPWLRGLTLACAGLGLFWQAPWLSPLTGSLLAVMSLANLTALLLLSGVTVMLVKDYQRQQRIGLLPVFHPAHHPSLRGQLVPGVWEPPA